MISVQPWLSTTLNRLAAIVVGLGVCGVVARCMGIGAWDLLAAILEGSLGSPQALGATVTKLPPLLLNGLAVALVYRCGLLNIGCEGQMTLGALAAAAVAVQGEGAPGALLIPVALAAGAVLGAVWASPALWLRRHRNVHEVLSTLILNALALHLADLLVVGPLGDGSAIGRTALVPREAYLPELSVGVGVTVGVAPVAAILLALVGQAWLGRTLWGFEVRATGMSPAAAEAAGVDAARWQRRLFWLSGALAGLAGALEVLGVHRRFYRAFSPGYGYDGITVAFLANGSPGWVCVSGVLIAMLRSADKWLQLSLGVSPNVIWVIQAILLLSVACQSRLDFTLLRSMLQSRGGGGGRRTGMGEGP